MTCLHQYFVRVANPRIREDRAVQDFQQNSDKMLPPKTPTQDHGLIIVEASSTIREETNADLYNVSTYQCSILFNNMGSLNRKSEFRKVENMYKPVSPNVKFSVTNDPQLSLLKEFWGNNYAHVILTAEGDSFPTDEKELLDDWLGGMSVDQKQ